MEIASVRDLSFTYPDNALPALDRIDLSINEGELVLLCGPSGCGKSTLLRHFRTSLSPRGSRSGQVLFEDRPLAETDLRTQTESIGYVGQSPENSIVTDKVWHELAFTLESLGASSELIRRRTAEMSAFFDLDGCFNSPTAELSGGQKQLVSLASAMTTRPSLLILDEPSSQLDPVSARKLFEAVRRINRELGTAVIISEHRLDEVFPLADRIVFMDNGRIVSDTSIPELDISALGTDAAMTLPVPVRVWSAAGGKGICPADVSKGRVWLKSRLEKNKEYSAADRSVSVSGDTALSAKKISFRYSKDSKDILDRLELTVKRGEFIGILGSNGSGKSTLMSVLAGFKKAYRGSLDKCGKVMLMPQEPSSLFCRDKLIDDLREMTEDAELLERIIGLCRLDGLTERHPFDLSGGELQRAALAKLMLAAPDILLLDEPTKGTDRSFKRELSRIIGTLCAGGTAVIAVTHDAEFAAENCTRCAMLFSGELIGFADPQSFFSGNLFYTTAASRMSQGLINNAVTADDIINALGIKSNTSETDDPKPIDIYISSNTGSVDKAAYDRSNVKNKKKASPLRIVLRVISLLMLGISAAGCMELFTSVFGDNELLPYVMLAVSSVLTALSFSDGRTAAHRTSPRRPPTVRAVVSSAIMLLLIPLTVFVGSHFLNTGKYLFVSLVVMLEASLPFYLLFESRRPNARELAATAVMTAAAVAGRAAFYMLPQFKPVLAVVVITGASFGSHTAFLVGSLSMLISNFMFGQGPWTPWQMFSMGIVGAAAGLIFDKGLLPQRRELLALFGFFAAVFIYGGIVNPSTLFIMHNEVNLASVTAAYAAGLPLDVIHGAATLGFLYVLAPDVLKKLERLRVKYGFFEE